MLGTFFIRSTVTHEFLRSLDEVHSSRLVMNKA